MVTLFHKNCDLHQNYSSNLIEHEKSKLQIDGKSTLFFAHIHMYGFNCWSAGKKTKT